MRIRYIFKELSNKRKSTNDDSVKMKIEEINKRLEILEKKISDITPDKESDI